jgi:DNA-binding MarR family transcriptional regulator
MDKSTAKLIGDTCIGLHVRRAARRITRMYDAALSPVGLTIGQFSLLTQLAGGGSWGMQPLADALGTDRTSLTAMLKPLEKRQLVASSPDPGDGRVRQLALTAAGTHILEQAGPLWGGAQQGVTELLGADGASDLRSTLARVT